MRLSLRLAAAVAASAAAACTQPLNLAKDDSDVVLARQTLSAPDPAERGPYAVRTLTYGSGTDRRRRAFRDSVAVRTASVDASPFVSMEPKVARDRKKYWGFDAKAFPVNGRVWYPEGAGPFPLVLVVHGNHDPRDFSDPGYGYLGEHLASRGYILVSVDENFLNGGLRGENDARGWMLLEHLKAWRRMNDSAGSPLAGKADLTNVALMGHSRGGEAVAVAAAFNRLARYPDDATVKFDYRFGIKGLVAIAPVDGQYRPAGQGTPLSDVNYLVVHGSHDGDVSSYNGLRQWERVRFSESGSGGATAPFHFKSSVWMYRANHGQWNTVWGNKDNGKWSARRLDLRSLVAPEAQRRMALVFVTAFLEATLRDKREYVPLFRDHRAGGTWLPKTMYVTAYADATERRLVAFDTTIDVTRGAAPGVTLAGDSLSTWRSAELPMRSQGGTFGTWGVWLGWNNAPVRRPGAPTTTAARTTAPNGAAAARGPAADTTPARAAATPRTPASFDVTVPDSLRSAWRVGAGSALTLTLVPTRDTPGPRKTAPRDTARRDSTRRDSTARGAAARPRSGPSLGSRILSRVTFGKLPRRRTPPAPRDTTPMDLTVELVDASGAAARLPLTRFGPVRRPLEIRIARRELRDKQNFRTTYELVPQSYVMPLSEFAAAAPGFDPAGLRTVRLLFDRVERGTVVLLDMGIGAARP